VPRISKRGSLLKEYEAIAKSCAVMAIIACPLMNKTALKMKLMIVLEVLKSS